MMKMFEAVWDKIDQPINYDSKVFKCFDACNTQISHNTILLSPKSGRECVVDMERLGPRNLYPLRFLWDSGDFPTILKGIRSQDILDRVCLKSEDFIDIHLSANNIETVSLPDTIKSKRIYLNRNLRDYVNIQNYLFYFVQDNRSPFSFHNEIPTLENCKGMVNVVVSTGESWKQILKNIIKEPQKKEILNGDVVGDVLELKKHFSKDTENILLTCKGSWHGWGRYSNKTQDFTVLITKNEGVISKYSGGKYKVSPDGWYIGKIDWVGKVEIDMIYGRI